MLIYRFCWIILSKSLPKLSIVLFITLCFFSPKSSYAQSKFVDSLETILKNTPQKDTSRANLLTNISVAVFRSNAKKAEKYANEAYSISKKNKYRRGIADVLYIRGLLNYDKSFNVKAREQYTEALKIYKEVGYNKRYSFCYNSLGATHYVDGNFEKALDYFLLSYEEEKENKLKDNTVVLGNIGSLYGQLGKYKKSIVYFNKVVEMSKRINKKKTESHAYNNLGSTYENLGDLNKAVTYYQKANQIQKSIKDFKSLTHSHIDIGRIYQGQKQYKKARFHFEESKTIAKKNEYRYFEASAWRCLGTLEDELENRKTGKAYLNKALKMFREIQAKPMISLTLINLGHCNSELKEFQIASQQLEEALLIKEELGDKKGVVETLTETARNLYNMGQYDEAIKMCLKNKKSADELDIPFQKRMISKLMYELYLEKGEYKEALETYKEFQKLENERTNSELTRKIAELEFQNLFSDSLKKSSNKLSALGIKVEQAEIKSEKSKKNALFLIIVSLILIILLLAVISILVVRNAKKEVKNITVEQKLLRTQMTPHFIFNSLGIAQGMILNKEYGKSLSYLSNFSTLLRSNLENSRDKLVKLENELSTVRSYVELQNSTMENPYNCVITLDKSVNATDVLIPPMLIQPFVENSIEHGFKDDSGEKIIQVTIQFDHEDLVCVITDNGIGINHIRDQSDNPKTSMATQITKDRLKILSKEYKVNTGFSINDRRIYSEQGTTVTLILPYKIINHE